MSHTARTIFLSLAMLGAGSAGAQSHNPYAGQHERPIKALSEDDTRQYLAGAGMGYARAAELNNYPGPMHVLDLADQLELSAQQRDAIRQLMDEHKRDAREIGAKVVKAERSLDELFQKQDADRQALEQAVRQAASLQGEYRLSHLETHRRTRALLTSDQIAAYDRLRGHGGNQKHHGG